MSNFKFTTSLTYKTDKTMNSQAQQQQPPPQQTSSQLQHHHQQPSKSTSASKNNNKSHQPFDTTSSILSDYDDLMDEDIDDNSSYVLFNPLKNNASKTSPVLQPPHQNESDILSLTNTSNTNSHTRNQYHYIDEDDAEEDDDEELEEEEEDTEEEMNDEIHHIIDQIEPQSATVETIPQANNLSNKINNWYNSSITDHHNNIIDDNIASWNLDENLIQESISSNNTLSFTSSSNASDQQKQQQLMIKDFYGDELFKYFTPQDLEKFRNFNKLIDIKKFLLDKDNNSGSSIVTQILNLLLLKNHTVLTNHKDNKQVDEKDLTQYIQRISKSSHNHTRSHPNVDDIYVRPATFSETTNSSLIICGGVGFGGGSSWNDI